MKILIADSGSTKTDWLMMNIIKGKDPVMTAVKSQGINPVHQSEDMIRGILSHEVLPHVDGNEIPDVYFYGSGIRPEYKAMMTSLLRESFPSAKRIDAYSDMMGAAHALFGRKVGIASILGTGANSCLYDGDSIVMQTPALGYILGDEGSGAVLGKRLLHDLYTGVMSEKMRNIFESETGLSLPEVISRVYREPLANRFMASLSEFVGRHVDEPELNGLVRRNFSDFLRLHIAPYGRRDLPVSFVGSIAWHYRDLLLEVAMEEGFMVGTVLKSPIQGLANYYRDILSDY